MNTNFGHEQRPGSADGEHAARGRPLCGPVRGQAHSDLSARHLLFYKTIAAIPHVELQLGTIESRPPGPLGASRARH